MIAEEHAGAFVCPKQSALEGMETENQDQRLARIFLSAVPLVRVHSLDIPEVGAAYRDEIKESSRSQTQSLAHLC